MNWGPGAQGGFQNALALGMSIGDNINAGFQQGRQMRQERNERNALAQFDPSNPETLKPVMQANPRIGLQLQGQVEARQAAIAGQQREAQVADLSTRFLGGDDAAGDQLAQLSLDDWMKIEPRVKAQATESAQVLGNLSLDLLNRPYEQRRDLFIGAAQQLPQFAEKIQEVAFLPQSEQDAALRAVVAEAKLTEKLISMERPQAFNVGPGEGRYERDPRTGAISTIVQPNYGGAAPFSPVGGSNKTVTRTGRDASGRRVVQYSDGTIEYAD